MDSNVKKARKFRNEIFNKIEQDDPTVLWKNASLQDIKKVIIILSAPRAGSSLLFSIIRKIPNIYSLSGESSPFYRLNNLASDSYKSDSIPKKFLNLGALKLNNFSRDLLSDMSTHKNSNNVSNKEAYIHKLILRFSLQWPNVDFSYDDFKKICYKILKNKTFSKENFYLKLIKELRKNYKVLNPYYYDISSDLIKKEFPKLKIPCDPPTKTHLIEEPPFILINPPEKLTKEDLNKKVLLLKTTLNNYRMDFIERIFPNSDISIIYLTRNPCASINGLMDGWNHRGYFSHNLKKVLKNKQMNIKGYSDKFEGGKYWWNYDLPKGWSKYINKTLQEICFFQWFIANKHILNYISKNKKKHIKIKFENIIDTPHRVDTFKKITNFIGLKNNYNVQLNNLPLVQITSKPKNFKWKEKEKEILPLIKRKNILKFIKKIGYDISKLDRWL